jgi:hypothetical protein
MEGTVVSEWGCTRVGHSPAPEPVSLKKDSSFTVCIPIATQAWAPYCEMCCQQN